MGWYFNPYALVLFLCALATVWVAVYAWRQRARVGVAPALTLLGITIWSLGYAVATGVHDLAPLGYSLGGLVLAWGLFRYRLFDIVPVARDKVIENMIDGVLVLDTQGRIVDANPTMLQLIGRSAGQVVGQPVEQILAGQPDLVERYRDLPEAQTQITVGEGQALRTFDLRISTLYEQPKRLAGRVLVLSDITQRKRAEEALRESEQKYRILLDESSDPIFTFYPDGQYRYVNMAFAEGVGRKREEITGKKIWDVFPKDEADKRYAAVKWVFENGETKVIEVRVPRPDGDRFYITTVKPILNDEGEVISVICISKEITERKRAEEAERDQRALAEALRDTAAALNSTLEFDQVLDRILANVGRVVPHDAANIMLLDAGQGVARISRSHGYIERGADVDAWRFPVVDFVGLRTMAETGRALIIPDTHADPGWLRQPGTDWQRSYIGAPIQVKGQTFGFMNLDSATPGFFTPLRADSLQAFADQAAIAIENARLYQQAVREADRRATLYQATQAIGASVDREQIAQAIHQAAAQVMPVEAVVIGLLVEGGKEVENIYLYDASQRWPGTRYPLGPGLTSYIITTGQTLRTDNISGEQMMQKTGGIDFGVVADKPLAAIGVPLRLGGQVIGMLSVQSYTPSHYTSEDQELLEMLAAYGATALENARLFEETRRRAEQMATVNRIGMVITSGLDMDHVLRALYEQYRQVVEIDSLHVALYDAETSRIHFPVFRDLEQYVFVDSRDIRTQPGLTGYVIQNRQTLYLPDLHDPETIAAYQVIRPTGLDTRSYVGVPLVVSYTVIGVLSIQSCRPNAYSPDQIRLLETIATQASIAIENARLYAEARRHVEELEQQAMQLQARNEELDAFAHTVAHDLKNPVSLVTTSADLLADEQFDMDEQERLQCASTIARAGRKMDNIIQELLLLSQLRKADVEKQPLDMAHIVQEARQRLAQMSAVYQAEITLPASAWPVTLGYGPWIEEVWVNYLSNAIKYGGKPPRIELGVETLPDGIVRFWIRDSGPGISPEAQARLFTPFMRLDQVHARGHGLGLSIVRRIVEKLGGQVGLESTAGQGSLFYFTLPAAPDPVSVA